MFCAFVFEQLGPDQLGLGELGGQGVGSADSLLDIAEAWFNHPAHFVHVSDKLHQLEPFPRWEGVARVLALHDGLDSDFGEVVCCLWSHG